MIVDQIAAAVSKMTGVPVAGIFGRKTGAHVSKARFRVIRELRRLGWSTPRIGSAMDRHHTSILSALKRAEALWGPILPPTSPTSNGIGEITHHERIEPQTPRHGPPIASQAVAPNTEGTTK